MQALKDVFSQYSYEKSIPKANYIFAKMLLITNNFQIILLACMESPIAKIMLI